MGSKLTFSTTFHPQTNGQTERTNQMLEDMLQACVQVFSRKWDDKLLLMEFAYNNNYQASIKMAQYGALYGRSCKSPVNWNEIGEKRVLGSDFIKETNENINFIQEQLKIAQNRQKSYADNRGRDLDFQVSDHVFLKVFPFKGVMQFGKKRKLSPRFIEPFEILQKVGAVAYRLALPPNLYGMHDVSHVPMLRKYQPDPSHVIRHERIKLIDNYTYIEKAVQILDRKEQVLHTKKIPLVKVQGKHHT